MDHLSQIRHGVTKNSIRNHIGPIPVLKDHAARCLPGVLHPPGPKWTEERMSTHSQKIKTFRAKKRKKVDPNEIKVLLFYSVMNIFKFIKFF